MQQKSKKVDHETEEEFRKEFAKRFTSMRIRAGYRSREEFANEYDAEYSAGPDKSVIKSLGNYERAESIPSVIRIFQFCQILGNCDAGYLLGLYDTFYYDQDRVKLGNVDSISKSAAEKLEKNSLLKANIEYLIEHFI